MSVIKTAKLAIISIVNTCQRVEINGSWQDKQELVDNKLTKVYNPKSIDLRFKGRLSSSDLEATRLFQQGFLLGSELRAINAHIGASNDKYNTDKLQLVDEAEYHIVAKATKGSTRKSKFRTATFDNGETVTFVTVAVPLDKVTVPL